jgi:hypothetical protein
VAVPSDKFHLMHHPREVLDKVHRSKHRMLPGKVRAT